MSTVKLAELPGDALYVTRKGRIWQRLGTLHGTVFTRLVGMLLPATGAIEYFHGADVEREAGVPLDGIKYGDVTDRSTRAAVEQMLELERMLGEVYTGRWREEEYPVTVDDALTRQIARLATGRGDEEDARAVMGWLQKATRHGRSI